MTISIPAPSGLPSALTANLADTVVCGQSGITRQMTLQLITSLALQNIIFSGIADPNGTLAGNMNNLYWDTSTNNIWICSVSGSAVTAIWVKSDPGLIDPSEGGTGVIDPTVNTLPIAKGTLPFDFVPLNNGEMLIGKTGDAPIAATITAGDYIVVNGGANSLQIGVTGTLDVPHGGSGLASVPQYNVILGDGVANYVTAAPSADTAYALMSNGVGANPSFKNISGRFLRYTRYISNTVHNPTAGANFAFVKLVGGGSSGAGTSGAGNNAASGGGGATVYSLVSNIFGVPVTITIGAGGASVIANVNAAGNAGGDSSFGFVAIAKGGAAPSGGVAGLGGVGGAAGACTIPLGGSAVDGGTGSNGNGGNIFRAQAGNTTMGVCTASQSGSNAPANTGSGGGGGTSALPSGNGAGGGIEVWEYA